MAFMKKLIAIALTAIVLVVMFGMMISQAIIEGEIKDAVTKTIEDYDGEDLSSIETLQYEEHYVFVMSQNFDEILAHPNEDLIGTVPTGVTSSNIPIPEIIHRLETSQGVWVEYEFFNPEADTVQHKRAWMVLENDLVFGSGYYMPFSNKD